MLREVFLMEKGQVSQEKRTDVEDRRIRTTNLQIRLEHGLEIQEQIVKQ